ncbi:hypothetical protein TIFTF001_029214 [Ficus carica]|uniref:Uncharacterized protein n=1 Tax=Ficus carica TaxID=3494 RepID=A0AA88J268_FICCA|nr:hypothetical protein TIFTF001_029214 [Ficus carica]
MARGYAVSCPTWGAYSAWTRPLQAVPRGTEQRWRPCGYPPVSLLARLAAPPSVTCKKEALRNDGDTGVVSAVGTPMLKRFPWVPVLGATRPGRPPRVPGGYGQQCLLEWLATGGDLTCDGSWWAASTTGEVWIQPMSDHGRPPGAWPGDRSWCNVSRSLPSTPSSGHPDTRL